MKKFFTLRTLVIGILIVNIYIFVSSRSNEDSRVFFSTLGILAIACYLVKFEQKFLQNIKTFIYKKKFPQHLSQYIFIAALVIIVYSDFDFLPFSEFLKDMQAKFFAIATLSCFAIFWFNRHKLAKTIEMEKIAEKIAEESRHAEFLKKFPRVGKIPVLHSLIKWMYREGWFYSVGLMLVTTLAAGFYLYNLGDYELREDEFQVVNAASGYYHTQEFYLWDWIKDTPDSSRYDRAWPHTWLISQAYKIFGISEWSSRIVSVMFGIIFIPLLYFIARFFTENKKVALLVTTSAIFYPSYISTFRYARMYALLIPIFLILVYFSYRGLTGKSFARVKASKLYELMRKNLNFNYIFLILAAIFLLLNSLIHINSLVILPAILLFVFIMAVVSGERKYMIISCVATFALVCLVGAYYFGLTNKFVDLLSPFERNNVVYLQYLTSYPFPSQIGLILLLMGLPTVVIFQNEAKYKLLYLSVMVLFSLVFFIYIADRYSSFLYISHITPIAIIFIVFSAYLFLKLINNRAISIAFVLGLLLICITRFYGETGAIYKNKNLYGNFSTAYKVITENYNPETDVIIAQYPRTFYLRDLSDKQPIIISMLDRRNYSFNTFMEDLSQFQAGYVTWETRKSRHISGKIKPYVEDNFIKLHGTGIDNTNVEVYYFDLSMVHPVL